MKSKKRRLWLFSLAVSFLVMAVIVCFSAQPGAASNGFSKGIADRLLWMVRKAFPDVTLGELNFFLRKLAHFTLYFILGCGLTGAFSRQRRVWAVVPAIFVGACFAASDELHQMFSDGRSASMKDVLLDSCGVMAGSLLSWGVLKICRRKNRTH